MASDAIEALREEELPRRLGLLTATLLVVANMIGTGVFTTTGLLIRELGAGPVVLTVWVVGGMVALCGALSYGELGVRFAQNGGEYRFLGNCYHPAVGFVGGFVSIVVGFAAPIAASALAFGRYVHASWPNVPPLWAAALLVVFISMLHATRVTAGVSLQNGLALVKLSLLLGFILVGAWLLGNRETQEMPIPPSNVPVAKFAMGLLFVSFAYSGYNAAAYLGGEVKNPRRNLPRALTLGTILVTLLYLGVNGIALWGVSPEQLSGVVEVGHVAVRQLFGNEAARAVSALIALALASSASAMILMGPRVYEAMGRDHVALRAFTRRARDGGPILAFASQAILVLAMLFSMSFDLLLSYVGLTLSVSAALTVAGLFLLRRRENRLHEPRSTWGFLAIPCLFLAFTLWMIGYSVSERPIAAVLGVGTIAAGLILYVIVRVFSVTASNSNCESETP